MPRSATPKRLTLADLTIGRRIIMKHANDLPSDTVYIVTSGTFEFGDSDDFAKLEHLEHHMEWVERTKIKSCIRLKKEGTTEEKVFFLEDMGIVADSHGAWSGAYVIEAPLRVLRPVASPRRP